MLRSHPHGRPAGRDAPRRLEVGYEAGEVRREVRDPPTRRHARPDHAFRAAFQAHLVREGVRDEVIDALVGHAGGLRARHYVDTDARMEAMREAVGKLPAVEWGDAVEDAAEDAQNVVVFPGA